MASFPIGAIMYWSQASGALPAGWQVCDGTNGTPDLRDRFVLGAGGSYAPGTVGGSNTFTIPSHTHGPNTPTGIENGAAGEHEHWTTATTGAASSAILMTPTVSTPTSVGSGASHTHTLTGATSQPTDPTGTSSVDHTHDVTGTYAASASDATDQRPPWYALYFAMRLV